MTTVEIKNIMEQFKQVISYSQHIENPKVDELFVEWLEAKRDFIEAMGGNLIYEYPEPVCFDLNKSDKIKRIEDFEDLICGRYGNHELANFIMVQRDGFFENRVVRDYESPEGVKIAKGMKLLKAFKFFEDDKNVLDALQTAASMIIQEDKIEGTLCLSVHPLDYLSVSENTHNWRSCHALDGDYRAGNLSYMKDKTTIVCYLKSKNKEHINNFPESVRWNSKKWRVLLYFSEDWNILFAGRQYPFSSDTGIKFINNTLLPAANFGTWTEWSEKKIKSFDTGSHNLHFYSPYIPIVINCHNELISLRELVTNENGSLQFNDLLQSSYYEPLYCFQTKKVNDSWLYNLFTPYEYPEEQEQEKEKIERFHYEIKSSHHPHIKVGGAVKCLYCGNKNIELTESMMCNDCEALYGEADNDAFGVCPVCGARFLFDDGCYVDGGDEVVCPSCAETETTVCANCGGLFYDGQTYYDRKTESYYCEECFEICDCELEEDID